MPVFLKSRICLNRWHLYLLPFVFMPLILLLCVSLFPRFSYAVDAPSGRTIDDGIYSIRTALDTGKALDVWGHSMEDGGDIRTYAYGGGRNERFQVRYLDDGTYSITALESGLALTATGTSNGSNVVQSAYSGSALQRWVILDAGNGFFTVAPSESDVFLNIAGNSTRNGANVQVWRTSASQKVSQYKFVQDEDGVYSAYNVKSSMFGAIGDGVQDDRASINAALEAASMSGPGILEVFIPAGSYRITGPLNVFSNTKITLDSHAEIVADFHDGAMLQNRHKNDEGVVCPGDNSCNHGGYTQSENITINGGCWHRISNDGVGITQGFCITHAKNIVLSNLTIDSCTEHFVNLSGTQGAFVKNCVFKNAVEYTGDDEDFWGNYSHGDKSRFKTIEAVHFDTMTNVGEASSYPNDGTPCADDIVQDCTFVSVFAGIGNHHEGNDAQSSVSLKFLNNSFEDITASCINAYGFDGIVMKGNAAKTCCTFIDLCDSDNADVTENDCLDNVDVCVRIMQCSGITVRSNTLSNSGGQGIGVNNSKSVEITGNEIIDANQNAVFVTSSAPTFIKENTITNPLKNGICAYGGSEVTAQSNTVNGGYNSFALADDGSSARVIMNYFYGSSSNSVYISGGEGASVSENEINGSASSGIRVVGAKKVSVTSNSIENSGTHGISFGELASGTATGNSVRFSAENGICVYSGSDVTVEDNFVAGGTNSLAVADSGSVVRLTGNTFEGSISNAVLVTNNAFSVVKKNTIKASGAAGIRVDSNSAAKIENNEIYDPLSHGISVAGLASAHMICNSIYGAGADGVRVTSAGINCSISSNKIESSKGRGVYAYSTTGVTIVNNEIAESCGHGIQIEGKSVDEFCSASITGNTSTSSSLTGRDIRVSAFCKDSIIEGNTIGTRGITIDPSSVCEMKQ